MYVEYSPKILAENYLASFGVLEGDGTGPLPLGPPGPAIMNSASPMDIDFLNPTVLTPLSTPLPIHLTIISVSLVTLPKHLILIPKISKEIDNMALNTFQLFQLAPWNPFWFHGKIKSFCLVFFPEESFKQYTLREIFIQLSKIKYQNSPSSTSQKPGGIVHGTRVDTIISASLLRIQSSQFQPQLENLLPLKSC